MAYQAVRWLLALAPAAGCVFAARSLLHYFQLESYQFPGYFHTIARNWKRAWLPGGMLAVLVFALYACFHTLAGFAGQGQEVMIAAGAFVLCGMGGWWIGQLFRDRKAKKPFVITPRVKRLYAVLCVVLFLLSWLTAVKTPVAVFACLIPALLPFITALAGLIAWPIEKAISELYFRSAQAKLQGAKGLIRVGITGSYGKTSVKFILGAILQEKYHTLVTPSSFNTPMGVTRVIREKLTPAHQVFVAEMGARHVGDIREMCRLVHPQIGILTSIGPQHLETFKTLDRIKKTKYELMEAVPEDGHCFFPDDGAVCAELYEKTLKPKTLVSLDNPHADVWAGEIKVSKEGSAFTLHAGGQEIALRTRLLGRHNIQNILLAAAAALHLGLTMEQVLRGVEKLTPVEHRLQLIPSTSGVTIIDDAFNSNPQGARAALQVLEGFPGRRIIITPGMVELGAEEAAYNRHFGQEMAGCVDIAILVGKKRTQPILEGLKQGGFLMENAHQVASLEESTELLHQLMRAGDVVLYENDLPDHYSEA